ncbi:DUF4347 domain-containing protein [Lentisphaerota bacterium ZTH]|nr:DUF4347 domain-containing protein [Lentisphaerota bacterium]WET07018.1 DUF4347 domain-containing protein [Lentisphaerota bacterium ZTH]
MYKLEDRILFDGAAAADVADAQEQEQQQAEDAIEQEPQEQEEQQSQDIEGNSSETADNDNSVDDILVQALDLNTGADGERIDVLLISESLENADDLYDAADSNTIVIKYNADSTTAAELLQQITTALEGRKADSIGFVTESAEDARIQVFADSETTLESISSATQQTFWNGVENLLDDGGQVNLFASDLASTTEGRALVNAISSTVDHDVHASVDTTGDADAGGDWVLEYSSEGDADGTDIAAMYFDENLIENFDAILEDHAEKQKAAQ